MGSYHDPVTVSGTSVTADLGVVEASTTSEHSPSAPGLVPSVDLPPPGVYIPAGVTLTDMLQRGAVAERETLDLIAGRPQARAPYRAFTSAYVSDVPYSWSAGMDATALAVDLKSNWRFIVDANCCGSLGYQWDGGPGFNQHGWLPSAGTDDLLHTKLDLADVALGVLNLSGIPPVPHPAVIDPLNSYKSRLGEVIRPCVTLTNYLLNLKVDTFNIVSSSPLLTSKTCEEFTVAIVANINEGGWSFTDLAACQSAGATVPDKAKDCTLRLSNDELIVYAHGKRVYRRVANLYGSGPNQTIGRAFPRPAIIVWSMSNTTHTGSLVVVTPSASWHANFDIPAGAAWSLASNEAGFSAVPGAQSPGPSGFTLGLSYFNLPGATFVHEFDPSPAFDSTELTDGATDWDLYEISIWDNALSLHDCVHTATLLDSVYGVSK